MVINGRASITTIMNFSIDELINKTDTGPVPGVLKEPYNYISSIPGNNQNMRYRFIIAFNEMFFKIHNKAVLEEIGTIISIFHDLSLLIDDIEDASDTRRGQESAHIKYGTPLTINCGNLMYFEALHRATNVLPGLLEGSKIDSDELLTRTNKILVEEMLNLHHGQGLDIFWRDTLLGQWRKGEADLPSEKEYQLMVMNKTGGLFRLAVKLMALFADDTVDAAGLVPFANLLGIIYQIRDDYMNLVDDRYHKMKGVVGEDLVEGKLSLPILYALREAPRDSALQTFLFDHLAKERLGADDALADAVQSLKTDTTALQQTYGLLKSYVSKAISILNDKGASKDDLLFQVVAHLGDIPESSN